MTEHPEPPAQVAPEPAPVDPAAALLGPAHRDVRQGIALYSRTLLARLALPLLGGALLLAGAFLREYQVTWRGLRLESSLELMDVVLTWTLIGTDVAVLIALGNLRQVGTNASASRRFGLTALLLLPVLAFDLAYLFGALPSDRVFAYALWIRIALEVASFALLASAFGMLSETMREGEFATRFVRVLRRFQLVFGLGALALVAFVVDPDGVLMVLAGIIAFVAGLFTLVALVSFLVALGHLRTAEIRPPRRTAGVQMARRG